MTRQQNEFPASLVQQQEYGYRRANDEKLDKRSMSHSRSGLLQQALELFDG